MLTHKEQVEEALQILKRSGFRRRKRVSRTELHDDLFMKYCLLPWSNYFSPTERKELQSALFTEQDPEDDLLGLFVKIPASLLLRIELERGHLKQMTKKRKVSRADAIRHIFTTYFQQQLENFHRCAQVSGLAFQEESHFINDSEPAD